MAWLGRLGVSLVAGGAIKWLAAAGIAAAIAALGFGLIEYGIFLRASKVQDQINHEIKINRERNFNVDRDTIDSDSALRQRLDEIERTWAPKTVAAKPTNPAHVPINDPAETEVRNPTWLERQLP